MNSPYLYHPQPSSLMAADAVLRHIASHPVWRELFVQGKMLGVLVVDAAASADCIHNIDKCTRVHYICAYSGVINGLTDPEHFFVPPVYDLQDPDDFYLQKDAEISALNAEIKNLGENDPRLKELKEQRKTMSIALQQEIFSHFDFSSPTGQYKNIVGIFNEAKRGLPPGGAGECAAPRLLQYAHQHGLRPLELAEFWYGRSPKNTLRVHGQFYPSCIEKCSPILRYQLQGLPYGEAPAAEMPTEIKTLSILYEDEHIVVVDKPAGALSVPGKVAGDSIESRLHELYPDVKGPMLVHRLDQSTSGILLAAKSAQVHKQLQQDFETRAIHKEYLAWLDGSLPSQSGIIDLPICPNPDDRPRQIVDFLFGKRATTLYEVLSREADKTLVRFTPLTGRTHQLRLHAASPFGLGHAIVGDAIYFGSAFQRLLLHAHRLTFTHPITEQTINITSNETLPFPGPSRMPCSMQP